MNVCNVNGWQIVLSNPSMGHQTIGSHLRQQPRPVDGVGRAEADPEAVLQPEDELLEAKGRLDQPLAVVEISFHPDYLERQRASVKKAFPFFLSIYIQQNYQRNKSEAAHLLLCIFFR